MSGEGRSIDASGETDSPGASGVEGEKEASGVKNARNAGGAEGAEDGGHDDRPADVAPVAAPRDPSRPAGPLFGASVGREHGKGDGPLRVRFMRLDHNPDLPVPSRASEHAAGYDIRSAEDDFVLERFEIRLVPTGFAMALPDGVECQVRPRSGLATRHGVTLPNSPGTIDPDYRGEVKVALQNLGPEPVPIARGERIAQLVFARFEAPEVELVEELDDTERGEGGFGSTGRG